MLNLEYKLNLKELNPTSAKLVGTEMSIEDRETGRIYLTSKVYMDKLFKLMGYKNLNVIKILEEYAGKFISDIGDLKDCSIFVDDVTDSFIVADKNSVKWVDRLLMYLESHEYQVLKVNRYDTYYYWDELIVKTPLNNYFAFYIDFADDQLYVLAMDYDEESKKLKGVSNEGTYQLSDDTSFDSLLTLMSTHMDISYDFTPDQKLSIYEYVDLLRTLGYVKKKKKGYFKTDDAEEIAEYAGNLDQILDDINCMSWLQQRITEVPNLAKFKDACDLISINLDKVTVWRVKDFYANNAFERSDFFALNY